MQAKLLISDPLGTYSKGDIGEVVTNNNSVYDYRIELVVSVQRSETVTKVYCNKDEIELLGTYVYVAEESNVMDESFIVGICNSRELARELFPDAVINEMEVLTSNTTNASSYAGD